MGLLKKRMVFQDISARVALEDSCLGLALKLVDSELSTAPECLYIAGGCSAETH